MEVINLSQYEERSYKETPTARGWVQYGDDNLFPQYLVDLYKSSATHSALCNTIAQMILGEGVFAMDIETKLKFQEWDLDDVMRKACIDLKIQGGFALEIGYSIDRTTIASVKHCPFENVRSGEANENDVVDFYWYSKDWSDQRETPVEIKAFAPAENIEYPTQILYVKPFSPGSFYYPKPDYIGSVNYIELDKEISKYHINNIRNGLAPSFTIHFKNGVPSPEERHKIRNDIERQLGGTTNAGKFIVTYSDQPERKPDFEPFPLSDADKQYQFLSTEVTDKIMVGHRVVSSAMFGVKTEGQLGNTQELEISADLFNKQVITPFRKIVEKALVKVLNAAGLSPNIQIDEVEQVEIQASSEKMCCSDDGDENTEIALEATNWLISQGEEVDEEQYELVDERAVDYETEDLHDALWTFASTPASTRGEKSDLDNEIVKIRYQYDPRKTSGNSRTFCKMMVSANKVYRKEDIEEAGRNPDINPGWGPNGRNTYDIFRYKGGGNCHHRWVRRTYLQKNNKRISVAEARRIIDKLPLEKRLDNLIPPNDPAIVSQMPYTMPNEGFLPTNPRR